MSQIKDNIEKIIKELPPEVKLVAVSKFHPLDSILDAMKAGQKCFAESRPQEFERKFMTLHSEMGVPREELEWHFIGHLQTNKLKMVLPYADMVQSVDSIHLLDSINEWGKANGKVINVLLELHIAAEQTKQGFAEEEILDVLFRADKYSNVKFCGLMGMATHTDNQEDIRADFSRISSFMDYLKDLFFELPEFRQLSIGMSDDWRIALEYNATMVRIGTSIFGPREY
ncbi:MAG TPA: YggS family pyridoxal phosphate-dependent enzyme [Rikenellaceae bacterium]|nr:YggS family pyridoxal phosphate-dependent enzyme [Rikenellaceae bacterium]HCZ22005.1 YggS family pyridoxal phosphate-dependent enzyme [Rikenellaceae bacterium]